MRTAIHRFLLSLALATVAAGTTPLQAAGSASPTLTLSADDVSALTKLSRGDAPALVRRSNLKRLPELHFHAIALQAGAQPLEDDPEGTLSKRHFLISDRGRQQVALAFEADGRFAFGFLDDENGLQRLVAKPDGKAGLALFPKAVEQVPINCGTDELTTSPFQPLQLKLPATLASTTAKGGVSGYQAKVAVEVDFPMMSGHFGNNTATALSWLQELFLATNLFYQRDLSLQLVMATPVIYNTSTDPYCTGANPCPVLAQYLMFQFGDYWRNNRGGIDRDFATLVSGRLSSGNPTGVSWIDQYCQTGFDTTVGGVGTVTIGSYGVNLYVAGNGVSGGSAAELFGHELGHQLGAYHNNCTDADTGSSGLQPIDKCRTGGTAPPGGSCWSGATSCPTSGAGLMMSSGCGDLVTCSLNRQREFHPVQIGILTSNIASHTPSCLSTAILPNVDTLYYDGFE